MTDEVVVKDFSKVRPKLFLALDGKQYEARTAIGLAALQQIKTLQSSASGGDLDQKLNLFRGMFRILMKSVSVDDFMARLDDEDDPIDFQQLEGMVSYLMEFHGLRPTEESSASADGSSNGTSGTVSTDGASPAE